jgi:hypothetical protein
VKPWVLVNVWIISWIKNITHEKCGEYPCTRGSNRVCSSTVMPDRHPCTPFWSTLVQMVWNFAQGCMTTLVKMKPRYVPILVWWTHTNLNSPSNSNQRLPFVKQVPNRILIELGAHVGSIWHHHITLEKCVLFKTTFRKLFVGSGRPRFDKAL